MKRFKTIVAAAALTSLAAVASAQMNHGSHGDGAMDMDRMRAMMETMMPADGDSEAVKAFKQADMNMMNGMAIQYTGDPDIDFRLKMIPHHQGAIEMAKVGLRFAKDPETKAMAEAIISAQEREIAEMQAWLEKHRN